MRLGVVLFTRDLRVHDNPALSCAAERFDRVVPLFVGDDRLLAESPNRSAFLSDALRDLSRSLEQLGAPLVIRRGDPVEHVRSTGADAVVLADDASPYAKRRLSALRAQFEVVTTPGITVQPPGELAPSGGDHYRVFTPYWRRWETAEVRIKTPTPSPFRSVPFASESLPESAPESPEVPPGGESVGLRRLDDWLDGGGLQRYQDVQNEPAADATSRLSPYLHFGCLSPAALARRLRGKPHAEHFLRQLCWRDFYTQLLWAEPSSLRESMKGTITWRDDREGLEAWKDGRTGYPFVDAAMRQLLREGWMHGRGRLVAASFLTKHLLVDWRLGEQHFRRLLVDGDAANNSGNWQWAAGTGVDTRPYRVLNPTLQGQRHDPSGDYVRRYVQELAGVEGSAVHDPNLVHPELVKGYPAPLVEHPAAVERFRAAR